MRKNRKTNIIFISFLVCTIAIVYFSTKTKLRDNNVLTLDNIKQNYKTKPIKSIKQFSSHYVLVNIVEDNKDLFEVYNLKTGDRDILPTLPYKVTISKIFDENKIEFLANGESYESSNTTFPFKIICTRNVENVKSNFDFITSYESLYLNAEENVTLGRNVKSVINEINLLLNGLEILFGPANKDDIGHFSDVTNIPLINTQYIKEILLVMIHLSIKIFSRIQNLYMAQIYIMNQLSYQKAIKIVALL